MQNTQMLKTTYCNVIIENENVFRVPTMLRGGINYQAEKLQTFQIFRIFLNFHQFHISCGEKIVLVAPSIFLHFIINF